MFDLAGIEEHSFSAYFFKVQVNFKILENLRTYLLHKESMSQSSFVIAVSRSP
jgi:hypothetical protein